MELPLTYRWLKAHKFELLTPWHWENHRIAALQKEYNKETDQDIYPFASRQDNDDIAGFKIVNGEITETVLNVHLTWSSKRERTGYPSTEEFANILEWIKAKMLSETIDWITEDELTDLNAKGV